MGDPQWWDDAGERVGQVKPIDIDRSANSGTLLALVYLVMGLLHENMNLWHQSFGNSLNCVLRLPLIQGSGVGGMIKKANDY